MANSHDINYTIRPAKGAERKMIVELCTRLSLFNPLVEYQYVGYGGAYFCDFMLFHRSLNLTKMVSIESDEQGIQRYRYNKPYNCVEVVPGQSYKILPSLTWTRPSILWMDETCSLSHTILNVMQGIIRDLPSGSLLLLTVNSMGLNGSNGDVGRRSDLKKRLEQFNPDLLDNELVGPRLQMRLFKVFCDTAQSALVNRNIGKEEKDKLHFVPVLNIEYQDSQKMNTFGGIVLTADEKAKHLESFLKGLHFVARPADTKPFEIVAPNLSLKEVRRLNECLPDGDLALCQKETGLNMESIQYYSNIYRYYVNLSEIIS